MKPMKRALVLLAACCFAVALTQSLTAADGTLPLGPNGQPLNLDFETGTLKDWVAEGAAFALQDHGVAPTNATLSVPL